MTNAGTIHENFSNHERPRIRLGEQTSRPCGLALLLLALLLRAEGWRQAVELVRRRLDVGGVELLSRAMVTEDGEIVEDDADDEDAGDVGKPLSDLLVRDLTATAPSACASPLAGSRTWR